MKLQLNFKTLLVMSLKVSKNVNTKSNATDKDKNDIKIDSPRNC